MVLKDGPRGLRRFREVRGPAIGSDPDPIGVFWVPSMREELALTVPSRLVSVTLTQAPLCEFRVREGRLVRFLFPDDGARHVSLSPLYRVVRVRHATSSGSDGPYRVLVATLLYVPPRVVRDSDANLTVLTCTVGDRPAYALAFRDGSEVVPMLDGKWHYCEDNRWFEVPERDRDALSDALRERRVGTIPSYRGWESDWGWSG